MSETPHNVKKNSHAIKFGRIKSTSCGLTKCFSLNEHGQIESTAIAHMTEGEARVESFDKLQDFGAWLPTLASNQAITCGIPAKGDTPLTTRAGAEFRPDAVARTNEAFHFPHGPSLYPIDVDIDAKRALYSTVGGVLDALEACHPWLKHVLRIARPSSSSFIGERGLRGVHVYLVVTRGADITALAKRMQIEQWATGMGRIEISKSGALLTRQLSDDLVYQPSRLMFEATPILGDGIARNVPADQANVLRDPASLDGRAPAYRTPEGMLEVQGLPALRLIEERQFETRKRAAKDERRREAKRIAIEYQKTNAVANGLDAKEGERYGLLATRALGERRLPGEWQIAVKGVGRVKVSDILADLGTYTGKQCADPFDTWRPDLVAKHFDKAEIGVSGDKAGVWSHKLQEFLEFSNDAAGNLSTPIEQAAEKFCGLIEYPEPLGKTGASEHNTAYALDLLLRDADVQLRFNKSTYAVEDDELPGALALKGALARVGCFRVSKNTLENAIGDAARAAAYDPWYDAMLALPKWDGVPRLDTFFIDLCDAPPSDALRLTGQLLFAGIVRRQMEPGAQCPVVPVLIGGQGTGKTRFVHALAETLGVPAPASLTFGDSIRMTMAASVSAIAEIGEMSGMGKRDIEEIKQWVTECTEVYRAPYERKAVKHPRRFVLVGTANKDELNLDATGNRRFMPVFVAKPVDRAWTVEGRQIFAEAKARFCECAATYAALVDDAQRAVAAFNDARMQRGEGSPQTVVSELAPPIVRRLAVQRPHRRVFVGELLTQLASSSPAARSLSPRQVGEWMRGNKWPSSTSNGLTYFVVPETYLTEEDEESGATGRASIRAESPFTKPTLAVVH